VLERQVNKRMPLWMDIGRLRRVNDRLLHHAPFDRSISSLRSKPLSSLLSRPSIMPRRSGTPSSPSSRSGISRDSSRFLAIPPSIRTFLAHEERRGALARQMESNYLTFCPTEDRARAGADRANFPPQKASRSSAIANREQTDHEHARGC